MSVEELARGARQLRIAVVTETYPPEVNGVAMTTGRLVDGLLRLGHRVQLIRPRQHRADAPLQGDDGLQEMLAHGIPIPRYNHLKMGLPARSALLAQWNENRPDVVQVVTEGPLGWSALSAARKLRIPVVSEFHTNFDSYSAYYGVGWLKRSVTAYLRRFHNRSDLCLVPTRHMQHMLLRSGYRSVDVVARGVDTHLFSPLRRSEALRQSWGAAPETLVVSYVGRLAPEKNLALLMRSFTAIRQQHPEARLLLVGDGPARKQIEAQRHRGVIFAGMRTDEDLAAHYASADMFLFPSLTETFGNVTTEALASGLPVVAFDYAAAAELVQPAHNGFLAPLNEERAFIDLALALAQRSDRDATRLNCAESVAHLAWETVVTSLVDKLDATIRRHHSGSFLATRVAFTPD